MKLGKKVKNSMLASTSGSKVHYPSMRINSKQFPHLLKAGVNKKVAMHIKGKVKSINPSYDGDGSHDIEMEVTDAKHGKGWGKHIA
jgi:hypothetical protein